MSESVARGRYDALSGREAGVPERLIGKRVNPPAEASVTGAGAREFESRRQPAEESLPRPDSASSSVALVREKVFRVDVLIEAYCHDDADADELAARLADFADKDERCGSFECWVKETTP